MKRAQGSLTVTMAALLLGAMARGDRLAPLTPVERTVPSTARTFVVDDPEGVTIMAAPVGDARIAGRTLGSAVFPIAETRVGPGCHALWVRIGADGWVCGTHGRFSSIALVSPVPSTDGLPWPYGFTSHEHTRAYRSLESALGPGSDAEEWEANWGFAIDGVISQAGARIVRTRTGYYLHREDLYRATPSDFAGGSFAELTSRDPTVPFGWVAEGATLVYPSPSEDRPGAPVPRLSRVQVYRVVHGSHHAYAEIGPDRWVRADRLRWIAPAPPPASVNVAAHEHWIDVDVASQTLIAYAGADPVYATMVSTGDRYPTPPGEYRIWARYLAHTMDNTESTHLPSHFRLGDVPYVQFFDGDRALHAVYWHDGFGVPHSHGCVNLSPRDAAYLFRFTSDPLPAGWFSREIEPGRGSVVRVRGRYDATHTDI